MVQMIPDSRGFLAAAVGGLRQQGWKITGLPSGGRLARNNQRLELRSAGSTERFRLLVFKIGESGRGKSYERRLEITSSYAGGSLNRLPGVADVVLGFDPTTQTFVGVDPRRLGHGGTTQNASTFVDNSSLNAARHGRILLASRQSDLFGTEYQAMFKPERIAEYLANQTTIHSGTYGGGGRYATPRSGRARTGSVTVSNSHAAGETVIATAPVAPPPTSLAERLVELVERTVTSTRRPRRMTPADLAETLRILEIVGADAEKHVLDAERSRLSRARRSDLAAKVEWVSQQNVSAGYDIKSFEVDGTDRFIEVKSNRSGSLQVVMTRNEWQTAIQLGDRYWLYLVVGPLGAQVISMFQDPVALDAAGALERSPKDWIVSLS